MDISLKLELLFRMKRIRMVEEAIAERYREQKMRCPTHLSSGQEAPAAIVGYLVNNDDLAISTHRAHAHYLGKGGDLNALIAEIYGKATGCSGGKGGSMHLIDQSVGFMGSTPIVGNSIPVGVGLALARKLQNRAGIACVFLGDGAIEEGVFYESINFCAVRKLPVLFVCENNLYSVYSPLQVRQPEGRAIHSLAAAIGINSLHCDATDLETLYRIILASVEYVRNTGCASLIEVPVYRFREHCGPEHDDHLGYRDQAEVEARVLQDTLNSFEADLIEKRIVDEARLSDMESRIRAEIDSAFAFAESSPFPARSELYTDLYTEVGDVPDLPWLES